MTVLVVPAATKPIVSQGDGRAQQHVSEFFAGLGEVANGRYYGAASGAEFTHDAINARSSLIRITFDLVPVSNAVDLHLIARTGNKESVTAYSWSRPYNDGAATFVGLTDTSDPQIILAAAVQNHATAGGIAGVVTIHNIQSARYKRVSGEAVGYDGSRERVNVIGGRIDTALPITGVQLRFSSGDIASGYVRVDAP